MLYQYARTTVCDVFDTLDGDKWSAFLGTQQSNHRIQRTCRCHLNDRAQKGATQMGSATLTCRNPPASKPDVFKRLLFRSPSMCDRSCTVRMATRLPNPRALAPLSVSPAPFRPPHRRRPPKDTLFGNWTANRRWTSPVLRHLQNSARHPSIWTIVRLV